MSEPTSTPAPPTIFVGWWRESPRHEFRPIAAGATEAEAWDRLLRFALPGDKRVTRGARLPAAKPRPCKAPARTDREGTPSDD